MGGRPQVRGYGPCCAGSSINCYRWLKKSGDHGALDVRESWENGSNPRVIRRLCHKAKKGSYNGLNGPRTEHKALYIHEAVAAVD